MCTMWSPKLEGVTTEADMVRVETGLARPARHRELFCEKRFQPSAYPIRPKAYEIYLPAAAQVEASVAMGPGGMPVASPPVPTGDSGHYAFIFPVRPGETRFQVSYHVPYNGSYMFQPRVSLPTANLAVALPKSMSLRQWRTDLFSLLMTVLIARHFLAKDVQPSQTVGFAISGNGFLPRDAPQGQQDQGQLISSASAAGLQPTQGLESVWERPSTPPTRWTSTSGGS